MRPHLFLTLLSLCVRATLTQWLAVPAGTSVSSQAYVSVSPASSTAFLCKGTTPQGDIPGLAVAASGTLSPGCSVSLNRSVALAPASLLLGSDARLGWWSGLPPAPAGLSFIVGGALLASGEVQYVCRGRPASGLLLPGTTNLRHQTLGAQDVGPVCLVPNGALVSATFVPGTLMQGLGTFDFLVSTPPGSAAADFAYAGVTPATVFGPSPSTSPSPTLTPSVTPPATPSPSSTPSVLPFYTALWYNITQAQYLTNVTTFFAGMELDSTPIYVCAGFVATPDPNVMDILPGKYEVNFGKCNVPFNLAEVSPLHSSAE